MPGQLLRRRPRLRRAAVLRGLAGERLADRDAPGQLRTAVADVERIAVLGVLHPDRYRLQRAELLGSSADGTRLHGPAPGTQRLLSVLELRTEPAGLR